MTNTSVDAFVLSAESRTSAQLSEILLYAASPAGPLELSVPFRPYFFAHDAALTRLKPKLLSLHASIDDSLLTALNGTPVRRCSFRSIADAERARQSLSGTENTLFESDVRPRERFLMDLQINGGIHVDGDFQRDGKLLRCKNPQLSPALVSVPLQVCSLDIETSVSSGEVLSIGLHLSGPKHDETVLMQGRPYTERRANTVIVSDERELFGCFERFIHDADPDIVIGWNVIGFDLAFLKRRAAELRVPLRLGRDHKPFSLSESLGRFSRAYIPGRVVLDGPQLLRTSFYSFESYSLEHVSQAVLSEGKLIGPSANRAWEIERLYREDPGALAAYNLNDAVLVTRIFEKLRLIELTIRRAELSGLLLDQVGLSTAALDHFYLPRLHQEGYAAPDVSAIGEVTPALGGYVMEPIAGLYNDIIALDFRSLYPSIIRTFNIDPLSRACADIETIRTPAGFKFSGVRSLLPRYIGDLIDERERAKSENNAPLSQAVKILMNSFYGVMGSAGSRFYHPDLPQAITSTGQWLLLESKRAVESKGHRVIYGDTDSLFIELNSASENQVTGFTDAGKLLAQELTALWSNRLCEEFNLQSHLLVEFKKHYLRFLVPSARASEGGAKKRYAGLTVTNNIEQVEFVGLEVVRSDWTLLSRDFQRELFTRVFRNEPITEWVRSFVAELKRGTYDDKLVYRKRLHKRPTEYGTSPPPYVRAALMLPKPGRSVLYVMTETGPVPLELGPQNPDYAHYIKRQLAPVADSLLEVLGTSFEELLSPQLRLF